MRRVRARTLVLVNWKGVFYERYALDEHVTALEGDNGAGKTTVMIAAYVALLPDMTRLRFTNVGEGDAIGGDRGIWGRLGNPNRPSYVVIGFDVGGETVLAGVHLERKGEPSVELTPFLVSDLARDVRLQEALLLRLGDEELVPELGELRENVARFGGRLQVCRTAKDYFSALFDQGITPLRLVTDEERSRFNDMLRTSMTGGISRALTSDFRSFLLKEESGLADTLARMRGNLEACRRTRTEVHEARELEREISGVYQAGHDMFAASLLATRERAEELRRRADEARQARDAAARDRDVVARELEERTVERALVGERLEQVKGEHDSARLVEARTIEAHGIARQVARLDDELRALSRELETAATSLSRADRLRGERADERTRAEEAWRRAGQGLADLQQGLDELHRRAATHRMVRLRLQEAQALLARPGLSVDGIDACRDEAAANMAALDASRHARDAALQAAEDHRADHRHAMQALAAILQHDVEPSTAHAEARAALVRLVDLEALAGRIDALEDERRRASAALARQQAVRSRTSALSPEDEPLLSARDVHAAFARAEDLVRSLDEQVRVEVSAAEALRRRRDECQTELQALQVRAARWRELDAVAARLEAALERPVRTHDDLEAAGVALESESDAVRQRLEEIEVERRGLRERTRSLEESGGVFHDDLLVARDLVDGELLASHFDEVDPREAGRLQARLGPLADAIVVEDARAAAATLAGGERTLDTIWLVDGGGLHEIVSSGDASPPDGNSADVIVEQHGAVRTTRVPPMPTLGRKARERLSAVLRDQVEQLGDQIGAVERQLGDVTARRRDLALLMREAAALMAGDPAPAIAGAAAEVVDLDRRIDRHVAVGDEARARAVRGAGRAGALRDLLAEAFLLDEPDLAVRLGEIDAALGASSRARTELARVAEVRRLLGEHLDALRRLPMSDADVEEARTELVELGRRREALFLAREALDYVAAHRAALGWTDAEEALAAQKALVPSLEAQCARADAERQAATEAAAGADGAWERARTAWRAIDDRRNACATSRDRTAGDLAARGVDDPSDAAVERARAETLRLGALVEELDRSERRLGETLAGLRERLGARERALAEADAQFISLEAEWKPAADLWERLRARAEANGLLSPAIVSRLLSVGAGSVNLRSEARSLSRLLDERLSTARGGHEILDRVRAWFGGQELTTGDDYLQAWEVVRDWLRRRVPAQVAETDDPLQALERLRRHLQALGDRLDDQERALRGASEDVARAIDVHIRAAHRQVRVLNKELEGVRFGTIRSMRIQIARDDRMEGVLRALREGATQELLFAPTMPLEDALETLFSRYGGRGPTMGQKLLDYREYVDLSVEVRRQAGPDWERVNPARLSTGEAIGVGTALMMVVLTAWERASDLFRARRSFGTLRLLFLDEANRLSQDNLEVLFELCTTLDLQLLIAAPEVARGPGCTTYRLVRRETADGGEEVLVSGRRAVD